METILDSLNNICDAIEQASASGAASTDEINHCCLNKDTGKMNCLQNRVIDITTDQSGKISNTLTARCGRCSTGTGGDPQSCDDYLGGYCDA